METPVPFSHSILVVCVWSSNSSVDSESHLQELCFSAFVIHWYTVLNSKNIKVGATYSNYVSAVVKIKIVHIIFTNV